MNDFKSKNLPVSDAHVVILINYVRRHHVIAYKELAKRVKRLTILVSTPMESDRSWTAEWDELDVRIQRNWMFTSKWKHPFGFEEPNFIHIPIDTPSQLKKLKPDIVFSYEFGMRTLFSAWYRRWNRNVPLVMVGNMSDHIERARGIGRRLLRRLLRANIDYFTYNGPSCKRYLQRVGIAEDRLFHVPYCFDRDKSYAGDKQFSTDGNKRLVYCGAISQRKGILQFAEAMKNWSKKYPDQDVHLSICGAGPLKDQVAACQINKFQINFLGNCDPDRLKSAYRGADICVFPTLADEWGLVPVEAMASGLPVLGSRYAQSVEDLLLEGQNGWSFAPKDRLETEAAIDGALRTGMAELQAMSRFARKSVEMITPERTANKFFKVIESVTKSPVQHNNSVATPAKSAIL